MQIEYCIDILLEDFDGSHFSTAIPHTTVWGTAYKANEVGKLFWQENLYVEPQRLRPTLLTHLPPMWRSVDWKYLTVGGTSLSAFEHAVNSPDPKTDVITAVHSLFVELLKKQSRWVVFFWYQCDDISVLNYQSVEELCKAITAAYRRESVQPRGFCSLFNNATFSAVLPTETKLQEGLP